MTKRDLGPRLIACACSACVIAACGCASTNPRYAYSDGSGNTYIITRDTEAIVEYIPVEPEESSSGQYDGGDRAVRKPERTQYERLRAALERAARGGGRAGGRAKGSGLVIMERGSGKQSFVVAPGSAEQRAIEEALRDIMQ